MSKRKAILLIISIILLAGMSSCQSKKKTHFGWNKESSGSTKTNDKP